MDTRDQTYGDIDIDIRKTWSYQSRTLNTQRHFCATEAENRLKV